MENLDFGDDTADYHPKVANGYRLPHVPIENSIERAKEKCETIDRFTTITDIEAQLKRRWGILCRPDSVVMESIRRKMRIWPEDQCDDEIEAIELYSKCSEFMTRHDEIAKEGMESNVMKVCTLLACLVRKGQDGN